MKVNKKKIKLVLLLFVLVIILSGAWIVRGYLPHDPFKADLSVAMTAPCKDYWMGTDHMGRCVACRILQGAATSLYAALTAVIIVSVVGTLLGVLSAYIGGIFDQIIMKITLIFQAFPYFILAVAIAGMLGSGLKNGIFALCSVYWITYARLSRSLVLNMRDALYIQAAKICGAGTIDIIKKYILPNVISPVIITAAMDVGSFILSMAGLSFLGLGAQRPTAEWGAMMSEVRMHLQLAPWSMVFPGVALFLVVILFNLTGDALRVYFEEVDHV